MRAPTTRCMFLSLCFVSFAFTLLIFSPQFDLSLSRIQLLFYSKYFDGLESESINCENNRINRTSDDIKRILLWTAFFDVPHWWYTLGTSRFDKLKCPYRCSISDDKNEICSSDAVLAHLANIRKIPPKHPSNQIWVLFTLESPQNTMSGLDLVKLNNKFDWITSYRRDSDIPTSYGITKRHPKPVLMNTNFSKEGRQQRALVFLSNCAISRVSCIKRLNQFYPVDIYGSCGKPDPCNRDANCVRKLVRSYKYFLAFENTECKDYITEKFWIALQRDILPIVKGASFEAYNASGPPNSFLHMDQFKTPAALAKHLQYLDENDQEYDRYFTWKKTHKVDIETLDLYDCKLCEAIHKNVLPRKSKVLSQWWSRDQCRSWWSWWLE